jgi:hypothetical protein
MKTHNYINEIIYGIRMSIFYLTVNGLYGKSTISTISTWVIWQKFNISMKNYISY